MAKEKKKINSKIKYAISIGLVLFLTVFSLIFSLYGAGEGDVGKGYQIVSSSLVSADPIYLLIIFGLILVSYLIDGLIILVFCRLYTRHYKFHQGLANAMIGAFYSAVTPASSGGQVMQAYTMKKQGVEVSNAASILVMWFIIYQSSLVAFDVVAVLFEWTTIGSITAFKIPGVEVGSWDGTIPMLPMIIVGFALNVGVILILFLMSYNSKVHNFIMHYGIDILAKLKILKNPDRTRENLRVQVENFKIELRRLQSNFPVTILIFLLFTINLFIRFSLPYFAGAALSDAYYYEVGNAYFDPGYRPLFYVLFDAACRSSFHQMVTGLLPLPGGAGVSELFFAIMFKDFFTTADIASTQILWRTASFHIVVMASGLVAALYHSRPREDYKFANRETYINLQLETFDERKRSSDTIYETSMLSRKALREQLFAIGFKNNEYLTGDAEGYLKELNRISDNRKRRPMIKKTKKEENR